MQAHTQHPGFYFFERGWLSSNNVLLIDDDQSTLIDSGYATHAEQTLALVQHQLSGRALDRLINTHLHSDHCGGNSLLQKTFPNLRVVIPPGHFEAALLWDQEALTYLPTGQLCPRFVPDHVLLPGTEVRSGVYVWEVHAAPGHDPHSVVLFEPQLRWLISADALWGNGFGVVFPELEGIEAFDEVSATLDLIEKLAPTQVFPGHGAAFQDVSEALGRARSRLDQFVSQPQKHTAYASKVLLKFKLMEFQSVSLSDFVTWAAQCSYLQLIKPNDQTDMQVWLLRVVDQLIQSGAARKDGHRLINI
jgi:glyoxylase-like metal-dependent hydrolase (beta-lactamase superfamily II)